MANLQAFTAKICNTVAGFLIHDQKILLIKHKKLGIWLAPGGHIEADELPHQAAEREVWEETGIKVRAQDFWHHPPETAVSENLPTAALTNLHWVSKENYQNRLISKNPNDRVKTKLWPLGCEQHVCFLYFVKPLTGLVFKQNLEETDGIGWFGVDDLAKLETTEDLKREITWMLKLAAQRQLT
jgi:8-oxo-dGTP pyrophosphatase MutT (NUDIX family)